MDRAELKTTAARHGRLADWLVAAAAHVARRDPREFLSMAAESLWRYKLRTALSILGVVCGVAAVIAMMSVSQGARTEALQQVELLGLDNLVVRRRPPGESSSRSPGLTAGDAEKLSALVPFIRAASPLVEKFVPLAYAGKRVMAPAIGIRANYQAIVHLQISHGRFLSAIDEERGARVCVLGAPLARMLFGYRDPVGETIRIDSQYFGVVGVLVDPGNESRTLSTFAWRDLNQSVLVPLSALSGQSLSVNSGQRVDEVWLQASSGDRVEVVGKIIDHTMMRLHNDVKDVDLLVPRELLAQRYQTQRTFGVVVGSVAALALVVGGIGIMNVMLTSVLERTREIGVRRTVGATRRDVMVQFLTESLFMTLTGGALGVVIGIVVSFGITAYAGWSTHISPQSVLLAFFVSFATGLIFGLYPAITAARLAPVEALHYE